MMLPRLYAIIDAGCFADSKAMFATAEELVAGGVTLLQYRNKSGNARVMLEDARELKRLVGFHASIRLIMNDRADLCVAADFDGVHLGQDDLSAEAARRILGGGSVTSAAKAGHQDDGVNASLKRCATQNQEQEHSGAQKREQSVAPGQLLRGYWIGVSTHNPEQLAMADKTSADYLAIGPVFATSSKANPDPVVGVKGVLRARELTCKPLVAIGGITRANARAAIEAGADAVAVISDLIREPRKSAEEFLAILG